MLEESEATLYNLKTPSELSKKSSLLPSGTLIKKKILVRKLPSSFNVTEHINAEKMKLA